MEYIEVNSIIKGEVSIFDAFSGGTRRGTYYQMSVTDKNGCKRSVNLVFDCFGKWISAIDIKNQLAFSLIDKERKIDDINEGDTIEVEVNKIPAGPYHIALKIYPEG